jgi:hypothetical protein
MVAWASVPECTLSGITETRSERGLDPDWKSATTALVTPEDLVNVIAASDYPSLADWEQVRLDVASSRDEWLARVRLDLAGDPFRRWAAAIVLARLDAEDGDELALSVLRETNWKLIPGQGFPIWEQAAWVLRDAAQAGRRPDVRELALDAIERSDLRAAEWTDVVDAALWLLEETPPDAPVREILRRVASDHWNEATRDHAEAILEDPAS